MAGTGPFEVGAPHLAGTLDPRAGGLLILAPYWWGTEGIDREHRGVKYLRQRRSA